LRFPHPVQRLLRQRSEEVPLAIGAAGETPYKNLVLPENHFYSIDKFDSICIFTFQYFLC
jgi:hypothetical protein